MTVSARNSIAGHVYPGGRSRIVCALLVFRARDRRPDDVPEHPVRQGDTRSTQRSQRRTLPRRGRAAAGSRRARRRGASAGSATIRSNSASAATLEPPATGLAARRRASVVSLVMFPPRRAGREARAAASGSAARRRRRARNRRTRKAVGADARARPPPGSGSGLPRRRAAAPRGPRRGAPEEPASSSGSRLRTSGAGEVPAHLVRRGAPPRASLRVDDVAGGRVEPGQRVVGRARPRSRRHAIVITSAATPSGSRLPRRAAYAVTAPRWAKIPRNRASSMVSVMTRTVGTQGEALHPTCAGRIRHFIKPH